MTAFAQTERDQLCDEFLVVGPDAPTLCEGWTTSHLATHLVVRDGRPDLIVGPMLPIVGSYAKNAVRAIRKQPWPDLVEAVRTGPPIYSPTALGPIDELVNLIEFFIHHEDVRRAAPQWEPRELPRAEEQAIWTALTRASRLMFRRSRVGVELISPYGRNRAKPVTPQGDVALDGLPSELVLAAYGRRAHARIEEVGSADAISALWASKLGLA
ncbi:MAG: TIGR03085 family metal-binding protein [Tetrasphaera jenkinsii]|jgi:uncharacterized protein (TIGR03085 family)|nr:TIGR03085 family metal-binding protein [Tetrasphaera jenkinsii]